MAVYSKAPKIHLSDYTFQGTTSTYYMKWDKSANSLLMVGTLAPGTTNSAALGTTALMWSDLFLASGAVINFNNGDVTITNTGQILVVASTWATAAATGRPFGVNLTVNAALGSYSNAIKGYVVYGTSGRTTGLGSAVNAEILLSAGTSSGTYAPLESEIVCNTNGLTGTATGFLYCNATGTAASTFDTNGYLFIIGTGITPAATKFASLNSQTLKCLIEANTRYVVLSQAEDGLTLGSSGTPMTNILGTPNIALYTTSADTSGTSVEPFLVSTVMSGTGGTGGRGRFYLSATGALGGWSNALKAEVAYSGSGLTTGLGSALCSEIALSAGTTSGTYAPLESEITGVSGISTGTATSFLYMNISGAGLTTLKTNCYLFELGSGVTDTTGGIFDAITATPTTVAFSGALKIRVGGVTYYIPLGSDVTFD